MLDVQTSNVVYVLRVSPGREKKVIFSVNENVSKMGLNISTVMSMPKVDGYIFIEGENLTEIKRSISRVKYARGLLDREVPQEQIHGYFKSLKEFSATKGDLIRVLLGPFRGSSGKVIRFDKHKQEVIVELFDSAVPISLTLKVNDVMLIKPHNLEDNNITQEVENSEGI